MNHGSIDLIVERCTSCMICARQCPCWCIRVDAHTEAEDDPAGRRPRTVAVLDRFEIDWALCMYCGICIEDCPFDALAWADPRPGDGQRRAALVQAWTAEPGRRG